MKKLIPVLTMTMLLNACAGMSQLSDIVKKPTVSYQSITLGNVSSDSIELRPTFSLLNSNSYAIPVDTVDYTLSLNGKQVSSGVTQSIGTLNPNTPKDITLGIDVAGEVLKTLQQSLFTTKELNYKVAGSVKVMGVSLPFEHAATIFVPEVTVSDVVVTNANMSELTVRVKLAIDNRNDFLLPLDNINYTVATNGRDLVSGTLTNQQIKQGNNVLEVPLTIATSKLVTSLFSVMKNPNIPLQIKVQSPLFNVDETQIINLRSLF